MDNNGGKNRLLAELSSLREDRKRGIIDDDTYAKKASKIYEELGSIEQPEKRLKTRERIGGDEDHYGFPEPLWTIIVVCTAITVFIWVFTPSLMLGMFRGFSLGVLGATIVGLVLFLVTSFIFFMIWVLILSVVLFVVAMIVGIEKVNFIKVIKCTVAEFVTILGLSFILFLALLSPFIGDPISGLVLWILHSILLSFLSVWIIKSALYTTWGKAILTWIIRMFIWFVFHLILCSIFQYPCFNTQIWIS